MKKILTISFLTGVLSSQLFGYGYSIEDGREPAFMELDNFIQQQNEKLKQKYISKQPLIKEILENHKTKELHLRHITILNVSSSIEKGEINFEENRLKKLKGVQNDE